MRFHRAALLVSSVSILSALNVVSAPLKVVVVEKVGPKDADDFFRNVRIGLAGAKASFREDHSAHVDINADTDAGVLDPDFVRIALPDIESGHNPDRPSDGNASPDKLEFPELPPFIKEAMDKAREEARKAATEIAEKEHELEVELKSALDADNEDAGPHIVHCENEKTWRSKANKVENWFRKLVGLALVQRSTCTEELPPPIQSQSQEHEELDEDLVKSYHVVTEENSVPVPPPVGGAKIAGIVGTTGAPCHNNAGSAAPAPAAAPVVGMMGPPASRPRTRPGRLWGWRRPQTFWGRLQKALYSLSPWEGRALAFVLGCGIGVLVRMIYVFIVLGVRLWQCKRLQAIQSEQDAQLTIFDVNELEEEILLPPPVYKENENQSENENGDEKRSID